MSEQKKTACHSVSGDLLVHQLPAFKDNYLYVIQALHSEAVVAIDPGDANVVGAFLEQNHLELTAIWNTHHHWDHTGGNQALREKYNCPVLGPRSSSGIPALTQTTVAGDRWNIGNVEFHVLETPGHTLDHLAYYAPSHDLLFCGDTLFSLGCGRLFEGTPAMMWRSLLSLRSLPDSTQVFCAHEYTLSNWRFLQSLQPESTAIQRLGEQLNARLGHQGRTVPSSIAFEKQYNPFLLADHFEFASSISQLQRGVEKLNLHTPENVFATLRSLKDQF